MERNFPPGRPSRRRTSGPARVRIAAAVLGLWTWGWTPGDLFAQPAALHVDPRTGTVELRVGDVLGDPRFRTTLREGLPLRLRVSTELWRDRLFDAQEGREEWRATVLRDPLDGTYRLRTSSDPGELVLSTEEEVRLALQRSFTVPLRPTRPGRYYYLATFEVETLSLSDLEELQRWLRGDLARGIAGAEGGVEGAVTRGLGRALQRALRLPALRIRLQSPRFDIP